ncbi:MAG TPA: T9SS type A sorting domain-containing protein, partial [Panacibacter sp.]|nr:T9SS type A sorting domain-containing protein [Panacibacter sp.]
VAIQPDGKIVVTGITQEDENDTKTSFTIRYNDDGSFDENFGDHGTVLTLYSQVVEINSIALQQDGKILIGGDYPFTAPAGKFLVVRYMPKGSLDNSFGINGRSSILIAPNGGYSYASSIAVQPDGKIITTGTSENSSGQSMTLVRFKEDGSIDASFGDGDGIVVTQFAEKNLEGIKVLIQPDRKILCAGRYFDNISLSNFALARYKTNGDLDSTFGINGLQITDMGGESTCAGAALQPDGKIIVAGDTYKYDPVDPTYSSSYVLARYYGGDVVMPITYNHFNAIQNQQYITLNWQTATELSNKHFAVERGNDAISFTSIADVSGAGSSTATHDYYYTDKLPVQGTNYYRLKQIGADGKFSYSKTVSIGFLKPGSIQLFPNPAKEQLTVKGLNAAVTSTIAVLDIQGKELLKFKAKASTYSFSISSLAAGTYMVSVKDDNGIAVQKFVKQ